MTMDERIELWVRRSLVDALCEAVRRHEAASLETAQDVITPVVVAAVALAQEIEEGIYSGGGTNG